MIDLEGRACRFATAFHEGQKRKYTGEPYIAHPAAVAAILRAHPRTPEMLAAAWLHDVVEDTSATLFDVRSKFGGLVAMYVEALTDCGHEVGNRAARKALDRHRLSRASGAAQTIKVADMIDNTSSIVAHDPDFARVYLREKRATLDVLTNAYPALRALARHVLEEAEVSVFGVKQ